MAVDLYFNDIVEVSGEQTVEFKDTENNTFTLSTVYLKYSEGYANKYVKDDTGLSLGLNKPGKYKISLEELNKARTAEANLSKA